MVHHFESVLGSVAMPSRVVDPAVESMKTLWTLQELFYRDGLQILSIESFFEFFKIYVL
jgi:hypothetical protein